MGEFEMSGDIGTTLLVASTGGHLTELHALSQRFSDQIGSVEWATFRSPQTQELLGDQVVHHVAPVLPRDLRGALANVPLARRLILERGVTRVISTGAGIAVPFIVTARELGLPAHYIESAARVSRPSLTGSLLATVPGVHLYSQHGWARDRWAEHGSVFDGHLSVPTTPAERIDKIVVTFGTQRGYGFRRAAERLAHVLPELGGTPEVLWQTGATDTFGLDIDSHTHVPFAELAHAIADADLVISHAGVGSALLSLSHGRVPVLLPRRHAFDEHADDHQAQIAEQLESRGLGVRVEADAVTAADLYAATARVAVSARPPAFDLTAEHDVPRRARRRIARIALAGVPRQRQPQPVEPANAPETPAAARAATPVRINIPAQRSPEAAHLHLVRDANEAAGA